MLGSANRRTRRKLLTDDDRKPEAVSFIGRIQSGVKEVKKVVHEISTDAGKLEEDLQAESSLLEGEPAQTESGEMVDLQRQIDDVLHEIEGLMKEEQKKVAKPHKSEGKKHKKDDVVSKVLGDEEEPVEKQEKAILKILGITKDKARMHV